MERRKERESEREEKRIRRTDENYMKGRERRNGTTLGN